MRTRSKPWKALRNTLLENPQALAVKPDLYVIHVGLNHKGSVAQFYSAVRVLAFAGRGGTRVEGKHHVRIETAAVGSWILQHMRRQANIGVYVLRKLVGGHHTISRSVCLSLQALNH